MSLLLRVKCFGNRSYNSLLFFVRQPDGVLGVVEVAPRVSVRYRNPPHLRGRFTFSQQEARLNKPWNNQGKKGKASALFLGALL